MWRNLILIHLDPKVVNYAIGIVTGKKYESQIAVGNGHLVIKNQVIGVADHYDPL